MSIPIYGETLLRPDPKPMVKVVGDLVWHADTSSGGKRAQFYLFRKSPFMWLILHSSPTEMLCL